MPPPCAITDQRWSSQRTARSVTTTPRRNTPPPPHPAGRGYPPASSSRKIRFRRLRWARDAGGAGRAPWRGPLARWAVAAEPSDRNELGRGGVERAGRTGCSRRRRSPPGDNDEEEAVELTGPRLKTFTPALFRRSRRSSPSSGITHARRPCPGPGPRAPSSARLASDALFLTPQHVRRRRRCL